MSWWRISQRFGKSCTVKGVLAASWTRSAVAKPPVKHDWLPLRLALRPDFPRGNLFLYAVAPSRWMTESEVIEIRLWLATELPQQAWWLPRDELHIAFRREEDLKRFLAWFETAELLPAPAFL